MPGCELRQLSNGVVSALRPIVPVNKRPCHRPFRVRSTVPTRTRAGSLAQARSAATAAV